ncbi:hypothetical protein F7734_52050 [Scytonema sp. UIC 10036]|uniref:hypothetical protein n=1 Tax=Scytonema sp. UIC 10036 TaxID=2304196 RepID=UPI0012DA495F|nr:hypothetical protein [Scytonema sp. UIC 10036]MUH00357.1 hypothetical protein [Scytonema sp. UIC 10036]
MEALRDRILKDWRVAKRAESRERIAEALDKLIAEISTPASTLATTPDIEQLTEWVQFAQESMEHGRYEDAKRDLNQVLRIVKGEQ